MSITHSIPEPNALAIRTPLGVVVHTGDWKIDPEPGVGETTEINKLQQLGDEGVLATVCDSTNALVAGESGSEATVRTALTDLIGTLKGRVAVTSFASNVARLDSIVKAAKRVHRREVALVGRAMHKITEAARETGYLKDFPRFIDEEEAALLPPSRVLYLCTGSQGESRAALARIARGDHPTVSLGKGDAVIFSSRIIPGNELGIHELHNKLSELGVELLTAEDHFVHVSGHPCRDELAQMYRWTRPQIAIPVHGEMRHQTEHARLARSLQVPQAVNVQNGHMLRLAPGRAEIIDEVPSGRVYLDGRVLIDESAGLAQKRRALAFAGIIAITLVLDSKGRLAGEPSDHHGRHSGAGARCRAGRHREGHLAQAGQAWRRRAAEGERAPGRATRRTGGMGQEARHAGRNRLDMTLSQQLCPACTMQRTGSIQFDDIPLSLVCDASNPIWSIRTRPAAMNNIPVPYNSRRIRESAATSIRNPVAAMAI